MARCMRAFFTPGDQLPTDQLPTDQLPTDQLPTDQLPTDQLPPPVKSGLFWPYFFDFF
jgi:hypothetical protein